MKGHCRVEGVDPWTMYDSLHDCVYRWTWDFNMNDSHNLSNLDLWNDVGYYALRPMKVMGMNAPVQPRDFCNQRAWRNVDGREFIIMNRSRPHVRCPDRKGWTRGNSICSGFLIRGDPKGCTLTYLTQSDLRGSIPQWVINFLVTTRLPQTLNDMAKYGAGYTAYKDSTPHKQHKPWIVPPQPWSSQPPKNLLTEWVNKYEQQKAKTESFVAIDQGALPSAPPEWYDGKPAMEWFKAGAPLGRRRSSPSAGRPSPSAEEPEKHVATMSSVISPQGVSNIGVTRSPPDVVSPDADLMATQPQVAQYSEAVATKSEVKVSPPGGNKCGCCNVQ